MAAATNHHKLGHLTKIYSLTVLEAGRLKSRCQQDHTPSEDSRGPSPCLLHFMVAQGIPWIVAVSPNLYRGLHMTFSLCLCLHLSLILGPTHIIQDDFTHPIGRK